MGHIIRETLKLMGTRVTCHVWAQGVPTWALGAEFLKLKITVIWCQVEDIQGWCKIFYPGMEVGNPLSVACERGQREQFLLVDRTLLLPVMHKLCGKFQGCIFWTSKPNLKLTQQQPDGTSKIKTNTSHVEV